MRFAAVVHAAGWLAGGLTLDLGGVFFYVTLMLECRRLLPLPPLGNWPLPLPTQLVPMYSTFMCFALSCANISEKSAVFLDMIKKKRIKYSVCLGKKRNE